MSEKCIETVSIEFIPSTEEEIEMKTYMLQGLGVVVLLGMVMAFGSIKDSEAGLQDEHNIRFPPPVFLHGRYPKVVIPGTYVYMIADIEVNILFYEGYWYRPYEGRWFWAEFYNGPWTYLNPSEVPRALIKLPAKYRREPCG